MPGDPHDIQNIALQWYLNFNFAFPHSVRESNIAVEGFKDGYRAALSRPDAGDEVERAEAAARVEAQCVAAEKLGGTDQLTYAAVSDMRIILAAMREGMDRGMVERIKKVGHEAHLHMVQLACLSTFDADEMDEEPTSFRELPESLATLFNDTFGEMRDIAAALSRKGR